MSDEHPLLENSSSNDYTKRRRNKYKLLLTISDISTSLREESHFQINAISNIKITV